MKVDSNEKDKYIIDIASERVYNGQSEEYHRLYTKWRNDPENPRGYRFIHDSREHIYVDGEGYADKTPETAEKDSLHRCYTFLGQLMTLFLLFRITLYIVMRVYFSFPYYSWVFSSQLDKIKSASSELTYIYCFMRIIPYLVVIVFGIFFLKLPLRVVFPKEKLKPGVIGAGVSLTLLFIVISRIFDYWLTGVFTKMNVDVICYNLLRTDDPTAQKVYFFVELFLIPIFSEIIFRGYILQLFRQFGDTFAIVISAACSAFCYNEITKILSLFILGIILGSITLKSGSLAAPMAARVIFKNVSLILNELAIDPHDLPMRFLEVIISLVIVAFAIFVLSRARAQMDFRFKLDNEGTELSFDRKIREMLGSNFFVAWLVISLVLTILMIRFV